MKLTKINNVLQKNWLQLDVYKVHDLTEQQSISLKGQWAIKCAHNDPVSFFSGTIVSHIFPILQGIMTQKPWKSLLDLFLGLSNHFISDNKMSLCYYMDPEGVMKLDSAAE